MKQGFSFSTGLNEKGWAMTLLGAKNTGNGYVQGTEFEPLTAAERVELANLRKQVVELEKDLAFLGKAAAYFATNPPKRSDSR